MRKINLLKSAPAFVCALLFAITVMFPALPVTSAGAEPLPSVLISTAAELRNFRDRVNNGERDLNAVLKADIDLGGEEWTPIATNGAYQGTFNGNGHVVKNYKITKLYDLKNFYEGAKGGGFFLQTDPYSSVDGLILSGTIAIAPKEAALGYVYVGSAAAYNAGRITNCVNIGSVNVKCTIKDSGSGEDACYVGGITGGTGDRETLLAGCWNRGAVSFYGSGVSSSSGSFGTVARVGGITGEGFASHSKNSGKVEAKASKVGSLYAGGISAFGGCEYSVNEAAVSAESDGLVFAGGVCGTADGLLKSSANSGSVKAISIGGLPDGAVAVAGGIAGEVRDEINGAYNSASVSASAKSAIAFAGGIGGRFQRESKGVNCANLGTVNASGYRHAVGGICASIDNEAVVSNSASAKGKVDKDILFGEAQLGEAALGSVGQRGEQADSGLREDLGVVSHTAFLLDEAKLARAAEAFTFTSGPLFVKRGTDNNELQAALYAPNAAVYENRFWTMTVEAGTYSIMNISWKNPDSLAFTVIDDAALGMASVRLRGKFCPTVFSAAGISDSTAAAVPIDSHIPFSIADEVPVIPGPLSGDGMVNGSGSGGGCNGGFGMASLALLAGAALIYRRK